MKKLLLGFGAIALLATGCTQPNNIEISPLVASARVYVVTADCGTAACPFYETDRYVFVTRNANDARKRLVELAREMAQANPDMDASAIIGNAQKIAYGGGIHPGWQPPYSASLRSTFSLYIDTSYL